MLDASKQIRFWYGWCSQCVSLVLLLYALFDLENSNCMGSWVHSFSNMCRPLLLLLTQVRGVTSWTYTLPVFRAWVKKSMLPQLLTINIHETAEREACQYGRYEKADSSLRNIAAQLDIVVHLRRGTCNTFDVMPRRKKPMHGNTVHLIEQEKQFYVDSKVH